jgi:hypothetical protein
MPMNLDREEELTMDNPNCLLRITKAEMKAKTRAQNRFLLSDLSGHLFYLSIDQGAIENSLEMRRIRTPRETVRDGQAPLAGKPIPQTSRNSAAFVLPEPVVDIITTTHFITFLPLEQTGSQPYIPVAWISVVEQTGQRPESPNRPLNQLSHLDIHDSSRRGNNRSRRRIGLVRNVHILSHMITGRLSSRNDLSQVSRAIVFKDCMHVRHMVLLESNETFCD